jgi:hypothetical protein
MTTRNPVWEQHDYRWRADDGSQAAASFLAAENTAYDLQVFNVGVSGTIFRLRANWGDTNNANANNTNISAKLQFRKNGGTYADVVTGSGDVRLVASAHVSDANNDPNQRLSGFTGASFSTSFQEFDSNGTTTARTWADNYTEYEFSLRVVTASVGDNFEFRIVTNAGAVPTTLEFLPRLNIVANLPNLRHEAWRARGDFDPANTAATWLAAQNTDPATASNQIFRVRSRVKNTGAASSAATTFKWVYSLNGGADTDITTSSAVIRALDSSSSADGDAITSAQLSGASGTFVNGQYDETGALGSAITLAAGEYTELETSLRVVPGDVRVGDTVRVRLVAVTGTAFSGYDQDILLTITDNTLWQYTTAWSGFRLYGTSDLSASGSAANRIAHHYEPNNLSALAWAPTLTANQTIFTSFFTPAGYDLSDLDGGTISIDISSGNSNIQFSAQAHRVNSSGTIQASGYKSPETAASAGNPSRAFETIGLGTFSSTDRGRIDVILRNTTGSNQSITVDLLNDAASKSASLGSWLELYGNAAGLNLTKLRPANDYRPQVEIIGNSDLLSVERRTGTSTTGYRTQPGNVTQALGGSAKVHLEIEVVNLVPTIDGAVGIVHSGAGTIRTHQAYWAGQDLLGLSWWSDGTVFLNGVSVASGWPTWQEADKLALEVDYSANQVTIRGRRQRAGVNTAWSSDYTATGLTDGDYMPCVVVSRPADIFKFNFETADLPVTTGYTRYDGTSYASGSSYDVSTFLAAVSGQTLARVMDRQGSALLAPVCAIAFNRTADLLGSTSLQASAGVSATRVADLLGSTTLSGLAALSASRSNDVAVSATMAAIADAISAGGKTVENNITLAALADVATSRNASLSVAIALAAAQTVSVALQTDFNPSLSIAASAAAAMDVFNETNRAATLAGIAAIAAAGGSVFEAVVQIAASGNQSASATIDAYRSATLASSLGVSPAATSDIVKAVALAASAEMTSSSILTVEEAVALAAAAGFSSTSAVTLEQAVSFLLTASLAAAGEIIQGAQTYEASLTLAVAALIQSVAQQEAQVSVTISATSDNDPATQLDAVGSAAIYGQADVASARLADLIANTTIAGQADTAQSTTADFLASTSIAALAVVSGQAGFTFAASLELAALADALTAAGRGAFGSVSLAATAQQAPSTTADFLRETALAGLSGLATASSVDAVASVSIGAIGDASASATMVGYASVDLAALADTTSFGGFEAFETVSLGLLADQANAIELVVERALMLPVQVGLTQVVQLQAENLLGLSLALSSSSDVAKITSGEVSIDAATDLTQVRGGFVAFETVSLNVEAGLTQAKEVFFNTLLGLGLQGSVSLETQADRYAAISLPVQTETAITPQVIIDRAASLAAAVSQGVIASLEISQGVTLSARVDDSYEFARFVHGEITLPLKSTVTPGGSSIRNATVSFSARFDAKARGATTIERAVAIAAQAAVEAAIASSLPSITIINLEGVIAKPVALKGILDGPVALQGTMKLVVTLKGLARD